MKTKKPKKNCRACLAKIGRVNKATEVSCISGLPICRECAKEESKVTLNGITFMLYGAADRSG